MTGMFNSVRPKRRYFMARKIVCRWAPGKRRQTSRCPGCFESQYALAAKIAAALSHLMNHQGDKVALVLFAETMKHFMAPGGTRSQPCCHNVGGSIHAAAGLGSFHREFPSPAFRSTGCAPSLPEGACCSDGYSPSNPFDRGFNSTAPAKLQCSVFGAEGAFRESRLALCDLTARVLKQWLVVLGIEGVE
jgi:hypothetical protein